MSRTVARPTSGAGCGRCTIIASSGPAAAGSSWNDTASRLNPAGSKPRAGGAAEELEALSRIIEALNERFGLNLGPEHRVTPEQIRAALEKDAGLDASAKVNTRENVRLTFDEPWTLPPAR